MIKLIINRGVYCKNLPRPAKRKIMKDLSFANPKYVNAKKHGKNVSSLTLPTIPLYQASLKTWWFPRGYIYYLIQWLKENNYEYKVEDRTTLFRPLRIKFYGTLRDYQEPAIKDILTYPVGVLEAGTGAGKTCCGINIIAKRKQPTLIIVHNKELLYQWENAIKKFLHYNCGLIGDGNYNIKHVTVGIINSVNNNIDKLNNLWGHIILDECHRVSSNIFIETLQEFTAKYFLGLTATPYRSDGLGNAIFACIGPILHTVDREMLTTIGAILKPQIKRISTKFNYMYLGNYPEMISELTNNINRNKLICAKVHQDFKKHKQSILIVSDRKKHCKSIQKMLLIDSLVLTSSTTAKQRKKIIKKMKNGECKVLISTISLIGEGFDLDSLSCLCLTTPIKFSGRLIQVCGRILRPNEGSKPRIYDFRDNHTRVLLNSGLQRDRIYNKIGW